MTLVHELFDTPSYIMIMYVAFPVVNTGQTIILLNEPCHEKTCFLHVHVCENKGAGNQAADQHLWFLLHR